MGVLPGSLPGHAPLTDEKARKSLEKAWGGTLSTKPGKSYTQMLDGSGESIKALYVMGANPASERPGWAEKLDALDFLVVQDLFLTETARLADVVLPAVSWAEEDGTFTNLERRVQRAPKAVRNPDSKAASDWMILDHLAARLGAHWPFVDVRSVTAEIAKLLPIYRGMTWDALGDQGLQWDATPVRGKAAMQTVAVDALVEEGYSVIGGTVLYDDGDLFARTPLMQNMSFGASVGIHPSDAEKMGIVAGSLLSVRSDQGELILAARLDPSIRPGSVWIPESLPNAPVGALRNGHAVAHVELKAQASA